jgi:hypothetical protein
MADGNWHTDPFGGLDPKERTAAIPVYLAIFFAALVIVVVCILCGVTPP